MKKALTILLFTFISITINAQSNEMIIGKWTFKDAYNKDKMDKADLAMLHSEIINKMTLDINKDGTFKAYLMGDNQNGTWSLSKDKKQLILNTNQEPPVKLYILKLTKNELALRLGLGEFLMGKSSE